MVSTLPEGPEWVYEIKLDGYRAQALCDGPKTQLLSRNGKDLGRRFPALVAELEKAAPQGSILDGELVALDPAGKPSFSLIQNAATSGATFVFFAFDLLQHKERISPEGRFPNGVSCFVKRYSRLKGFSFPKASMFPPSRCLIWSEAMGWRV